MKKTDLEIAHEITMRPIKEVAQEIGIPEEELEYYGKYKAKISKRFEDGLSDHQDGKLILVTAMTPTKAGEGKTTTTIGLADGLRKKGYRIIGTLREPSLGPVFGIKGGATGGGYAQVVPMEEINLHFTGDIHAITSANNLIAAMIDNHIYHGNELHINPKKILWNRAMDMNDRALRQITVGEGTKNGVERTDHFNISVASEIMAIMCLSTDIHDFQKRVKRAVVALDTEDHPITVGDLKADGAVTALMKDALKPNLVQSLEHTPFLIHGGPFANIAHGCNSIIATKTALKLADFVVTEAGFGADLGCEKFLDLKCRLLGKHPDVIVLVVTIRAMKLHGGVAYEKLPEENVEAVEKGFANVKRHAAILREAGIPFVIALNHFALDTVNEIAKVKELCEKAGYICVEADGWDKGGSGMIELADEVVRLAKMPSHFHYFYDDSDSLETKLEKIARKVYGGVGVQFTREAQEQLEEFHKNGWDQLPVCVAKTQNSLSDDPKLIGAPEGFAITVKELRISAGAGFVVALTGNIMTMPGLPAKPAAEQIGVDEQGNIYGIF